MAAVHVAVHGDATDIATFGGIPWHVTDGLRRAGVDAHGLKLDESSRAGRIAWSAGQLLLTGGYGGYQYSPAHLDRLWLPVRERIRGGHVLNLFQLYAPSVNADPTVRRWFYIDATLQQLIEGYGGLTRMAARAMRDLLARERDGYASANGVVVYSQWVADSLIRDYAIDPAKVHVIVAGANLDLDHYARWRASAAPPGEEHGPLRLIFIGKDAHRKGLDRLLEAMIVARCGGAALALTVIGCDPDTVAPGLRTVPGVTWLGRIDKRREADRFSALVAGAEVGCLLSRAECSGIGQREYAAFGLALIAPDTGGSADHAGRHRSVLVQPADGADAIAATLAELATRGALYRRLRAAAWDTRDEPLQTTTARRLRALLLDQAAA